MSPFFIARSGENLAKPWADFNETEAQIFFLEKINGTPSTKNKLPNIFKIDRGEEQKTEIERKSENMGPPDAHPRDQEEEKVASLVDQQSGTLLYFKRISKKRKKVIGNADLKHQMMNNRLLITKDLRGDVVIKTILRKMRKVYIKQFY